MGRNWGRSSSASERPTRAACDEARLTAPTVAGTAEREGLCTDAKKRPGKDGNRQTPPCVERQGERESHAKEPQDTERE